MISKGFPISRQDDIVIQELLGEVLIYDLKIDKAFCLNETSAMVWKLCDGTKSVSEIAESINDKVDSPVAEDLIWLALDQLKKENLLSNGSEIVSKFKGVSRREVIKKIGLAAMVALPVISSLAAPTAAAAQSVCIPLDDPCDGKTPCCDGGICITISSTPVCVGTV